MGTVKCINCGAQVTKDAAESLGHPNGGPEEFICKGGCSDEPQEEAPEREISDFEGPDAPDLEPADDAQEDDWDQMTPQQVYGSDHPMSDRQVDQAWERGMMQRKGC